MVRGQLGKLGLFSQLVGPVDWTMLTRMGNTHLYPLSHLSSPQKCINNKRWENDILELPLEKKDNSRYWLGHGDMGTLVNCCRDYEMMAPLRNIIWLTFKTIRNKLLYYPATPLLGMNIQKLESRNCGYFYTNFHSSIIHNIQEIVRALFRSHCLGKCHGRNNFKSSDIIN